MLGEQQVVAIYKAKLALRAQSRDNSPDTKKMQLIKSQSARVAVMYGVTPRTIRDIWNRQSWIYATRHLWILEPQLSDENMRSSSAVKVLIHPVLSPFLRTVDGVNGLMS
jgi:hypothetical protein